MKTIESVVGDSPLACECNPPASMPRTSASLSRDGLVDWFVRSGKESTPVLASVSGEPQLSGDAQGDQGLRCLRAYLLDPGRHGSGGFAMTVSLSENGRARPLPGVQELPAKWLPRARR